MLNLKLGAISSGALVENSEHTIPLTVGVQYDGTTTIDVVRGGTTAIFATGADAPSVQGNAGSRTVKFKLAAKTQYTSSEKGTLKAKVGSVESNAVEVAPTDGTK